MFSLIGWAIYGLVAGVLGKVVVSFVYPNAPQEANGVGLTILVGVVGSYIGGILNYVLNFGGEPFSPAGLIMGAIGAALALGGLHYYRTKSKLNG